VKLRLAKASQLSWSWGLAWLSLAKFWVKIRSVTAEIFLIWANVARTNVAWTNITATVGKLNQVALVSVCAKF